MVNADLVAFVRRVHAAAIPGGTLTSWYRDARRNLMCGGDPRSKHLRGLAIDYQPAQGRRLLDAIALRRSGLTVVDEGTHLHVQL
jgi:hypothetical protein